MKQKTIILTVGISASGKSTWINNYIKEHGIDDLMIIERDEFRLEILNERSGRKHYSAMDWKYWQWRWEADVDNLIEVTIKEDLASREVNTMIVVETNLYELQRTRNVQRFVKFGFVPEVITYQLFPIDLATAIERDIARAPHTVGEEVITQQLERLDLEESVTLTYEEFKQTLWARH